MSAKHTPGPWEYDCRNGFVVAGGVSVVCQTWNKWEENFQNTEENGRLIAAAPDLLEALEAVIASWRTVCSANGWEPMELQEHRAAVDAIKKARGES